MGIENLLRRFLKNKKRRSRRKISSVALSCTIHTYEGGRRGRDRTVVGFTATCAISAYVSSNPVYYISVDTHKTALTLRSASPIL
jgi:hypothetical protein